MWSEWRRKVPISWRPGRWVLPSFHVRRPEEAFSRTALFECRCLSQAVRSDSASDGQVLGETRKQLKEETLLRLVRFGPFFSPLLKWIISILSLFIEVGLHVFQIPRNSLRLLLYLTAAGRGEGAGGADWDETGDGDVHEDAGEGHMREAGRADGAAAAAGGPPRHQPTAAPQVAGEAATLPLCWTPRETVVDWSGAFSKGYLHLLVTNILTFPRQSSDASSKQKSETISRLEEKIHQMTGTVKQMEARWGPTSIFLPAALVNKCCTWVSSEATLIFDCAVFFPPSFSLFCHSHDFLFRHVKQRDQFGEAGQKPELGSREATAVSAVAPTSLTSNRTILPNIDITKLGFHLSCTSLLCCWKSNQSPTTSRS